MLSKRAARNSSGPWILMPPMGGGIYERGDDHTLLRYTKRDIRRK